MRCSACGATNRSGAGFCDACGKPVEPSADSPTRELPAGVAALNEPIKRALAGKYEIRRVLGRGGMGTVHMARETALDRFVAIKVLSSGTGMEPRDVERFMQEARLAARLRHPNIVSIHDVGECEGFHYFTMDFIEGDTLDAHVRARGTLPEPEARLVMVEIARALQHAHKMGIIHRDLKPSNIMIDHDGHVLVMDFGLAKSLSQSGVNTGSFVVGTPQYMSPEQLEGSPASTRSDIYALGLVYYFMLRGEDAVQGEIASVVAQHVSGRPFENVARDARLRAIPLLGSMVAREAERRPGSVSEILSALGYSSRPSGSMVTASVPVPRRTARWAAAAAFVLTACLVLALALRGSSPSVAAPPQPAAAATAAAPSATYERLTFSGDAFNAEVSPDGRSIAYLKPDSGGVRIQIEDVGGGTIEVLALTGCTDLRWSPDGSALLAVALHGGDASWQLLVVPRLGGMPRTQHRNTYSFRAAWAPDGKRIAAALLAASEILLVDASAPAPPAVVRLPGSIRWLDDVDWSPNGRLLLYQTRDEKERTALHVIGLDGRGHHVVAQEETPILSAPHWSPNGRAVYYLRRHKATQELYRIAVDPATGAPAGAPNTLIPDLQTSSFSLTADGRHMVFGRGDSQSNLWLEQPKGGEAPVQLTTGTFQDIAPRISPDGRDVVFVRASFDRSNLHSVPIAGGQVRQLTHAATFVGAPGWSPDATEMAFVCNDGGTARVWIVPSRGGPPRRLERTTPSADSLYLAWSPASKILYQRNGHRGFVIVDPATGDERGLVDESVGWLFQAVPSPDGTEAVAYWNREDGRGLWRLPLDDGEPKLLRPGRSYPFAWLPNGRILVVESGAEDGAILSLPSVAGAEEKLILPKPLGTGCDTTDGQRFVCSVAENRSDVWRVAHFDPSVR